MALVYRSGILRQTDSRQQLHLAALPHNASSTIFSHPSSANIATQLPIAAPTHRTHQRCSQLARRPDVSATALFPVDLAWNPNVDAASVAPQLFAFSLFPYLGFLFFLHKSGKAPKLTLIGFYFLLAFVGATIPAGIYAKTHYGTALANVDWLHGSAESLLTITNLLIVLGLRQGIREQEKAREQERLQQQEREAASTAENQPVKQR